MLVSDADNGGDCACVWVGGIWGISIPPSQVCCKTKTALKLFSLKKKKEARVSLACLFALNIKSWSFKMGFSHPPSSSEFKMDTNKFRIDQKKKKNQTDEV